MITDIEEERGARAALEKAFDQIKHLKDRLRDENLALREQIDQAFMFEEIVGSSAALQTVLSNIVKVAPTESTVLITGETGTGKELIARAIHKRSPRSGQAFISVNCASIPVTLIASELFGHEKGAFTGAMQRRQGRFELAHSGTIFLDEIGELPAETHVAFLRVLQERQFERVGGKRLLSTDVSRHCCDQPRLAVGHRSGNISDRSALPIKRLPIEVPPLRNKEDIPMLVEYFVRRYAEKAGKQIRKISKKSCNYAKHLLGPAIFVSCKILSRGQSSFAAATPFGSIRSGPRSQSRAVRERATAMPETAQNQEKEMIEAALAESKGKVAGPNGAASKLGIPRLTLP